jgi:hypothetical protein
MTWTSKYFYFAGGANTLAGVNVFPPGVLTRLIDVLYSRTT